MGKIVKGAFKEASDKERLAAEATARLADIAVTVASLRQATSSTKSAAIELSLEMAKRIVLKSIELEPAVLDGIYTRALETAQGLSRATIHVHPTDHGASSIDEMATKLDFSVEEDETVGRGGCRVVLGHHEIDATMTTLIDAFRSALQRTANVST